MLTNRRKDIIAMLKEHFKTLPSTAKRARNRKSLLLIGTSSGLETSTSAAGSDIDEFQHEGVGVPVYSDEEVEQILRAAGSASVESEDEGDIDVPIESQNQDDEGDSVNQEGRQDLVAFTSVVSGGPDECEDGVDVAALVKPSAIDDQNEQ